MLQDARVIKGRAIGCIRLHTGRARYHTYGMLRPPQMMTEKLRYFVAPKVLYL